MSNFQKDVQLLTDLQELISDAERTANMPGYAGAVFNAISPALKAAMPAAQKKARRVGFDVQIRYTRIDERETASIEKIKI